LAPSFDTITGSRMSQTIEIYLLLWDPIIFHFSFLTQLLMSSGLPFALLRSGSIEMAISV
jgi:hypothetical protein